VIEREALIADLVATGLAKNEALAWLTLLADDGDVGLTGYEVAARSGIPRSAIYAVLRKLEAVGAAFQVSADPALFAPTEPAVWLGRQRQRALGRLEAVEAGLSKLPKRVRPEPVWIVNPYDDVLTRANDMIRRAERSIYLSAWPRELKVLGPAMADAAERDVHRVLHVPSALPTPPPGFSCWIDDSPGDAGSAGWSHKLLVVVDGAEALIGGSEPLANNQAVWTRNPALVDVATNHIILDITLLATQVGRDCAADVAPMMRPHLPG
jgi:HTH-type transcriptional regulator, sugar sensing transcriptional regulator